MRRSRGLPALSAVLLTALFTTGLLQPADAGDKPGARPPFTAADSLEARPDELSADVRFPADDRAAYEAWLSRAPRAADEPWLVLSGGGENGAFGAGLLVGWNESGKRPDFGVVTGVSTGAMIAPFAFVGRTGDAVLRETYTGITAADIFEFGGDDAALTDTWPLKKLIARYVTPELLAEVAEAHRAGRRLLVVTTNVDTQRPVAWDMGAIAASGSPKALELFRSVILASAAIPGIFPPVMIPARAEGKAFEEMHVDGGTMAPFYLGPASVLRGEGGVPARQVYVVVNGNGVPDFQVTERTTLSVLGRSMSAAIRAQTAASLALHRAFAARSGIDLEVATIDARFRATSPAPFDQGYMRALFAHAEALGRAGNAFDIDATASITASSSAAASTAASSTAPHQVGRSAAR
jgi:predicted acylesterase/phospholipase RssA